VTLHVPLSHVLGYHRCLLKVGNDIYLQGYSQMDLLQSCSFFKALLLIENGAPNLTRRDEVA
jgi:hypothetical protein